MIDIYDTVVEIHTAQFDTDLKVASDGRLEIETYYGSVYLSTSDIDTLQRALLNYMNNGTDFTTET